MLWAVPPSIGLTLGLQYGSVLAGELSCLYIYPTLTSHHDFFFLFHSFQTQIYDPLAAD